MSSKIRIREGRLYSVCWVKYVVGNHAMDICTVRMIMSDYGVDMSSWENWSLAGLIHDARILLNNNNNNNNN